MRRAVTGFATPRIVSRRASGYRSNSRPRRRSPLTPQCRVAKMRLVAICCAQHMATYVALGTMLRMGSVARRASDRLRAERALMAGGDSDRPGVSATYFGSPLRLGVTRPGQSPECPAPSWVRGDSSDLTSCAPLERLRPCPFRRPSMAGGRRPRAATSLHHKHRGRLDRRGRPETPCSGPTNRRVPTHGAVEPRASCAGPRSRAPATRPASGGTAGVLRAASHPQMTRSPTYFSWFCYLRPSRCGSTTNHSARQTCTSKPARNSADTCSIPSGRRVAKPGRYRHQPRRLRSSRAFNPPEICCAGKFVSLQTAPTFDRGQHSSERNICRRSKRRLELCSASDAIVRGTTAGDQTRPRRGRSGPAVGLRLRQPRRRS